MTANNRLKALAAATAIVLGSAMNAQAATVACGGVGHGALGGIAATLFLAGMGARLPVLEVLAARNHLIALAPSPGGSMPDRTAAATGPGASGAPAPAIDLSPPGNRPRRDRTFSSVLSAVPLPGILTLLGIGIAGLGLLRRRAA